MKSNELYISFSNLNDLKNAIQIADNSCVEIVNIISPMYLNIRHNKYKGSIIGITSFIFSIIALVLVLYFQWWTSSKDYPLNIGGREFFSWAFSIPVAYELTILFAAIGVFVAFLIITKLPKWLSSESELNNMSDDLILIIKNDRKSNEYLTKINHNDIR